MAVTDLNKSKEFFEKVGYSFNKQFTDETAAAMVISKDIYAMLLTHPKIKQFTDKEIVDAKKSTEVLLALSVDSKESVDEMLKKVINAGGKEYREKQDLSFIYSRSYEDLDGHIWEIFWMDPSFVEKS